jgi:hypothetical protein
MRTMLTTNVGSETRFLEASSLDLTKPLPGKKATGQDLRPGKFGLALRCRSDRSRVTRQSIQCRRLLDRARLLLPLPFRWHLGDLDRFSGLLFGPPLPLRSSDLLPGLWR